MPAYLSAVFKKWAIHNTTTITQENFEKNVDEFFEEKKDIYLIPQKYDIIMSN